MIKKVFIGLALALLVALPATAQDFQNGVAAFKRGDYTAAFKEWRPLAERGYANAQLGLAAMYDHGQGARHHSSAVDPVVR